jgi:hypothetical protein
MRGSRARFSRVLLLLACFSPGWRQVVTYIAGTDWLFPGDGRKAIRRHAEFMQDTDIAIHEAYKHPRNIRTSGSGATALTQYVVELAKRLNSMLEVTCSFEGCEVIL